ncbi:MAG: pyridoxamine 5'-phosphate oxidase [Hyphomicrobiales bacterium]|nr:pyridoxamine 5'-phosphate oxidase [Rickettsiales bacterium]MCP5361480.1 pyridoxamine 5'-phosphate oxidase [Hyphomicrobiales bacterium]
MILEHAQDPFTLFSIWFNEAEASEPADPNAMTLATVNKDGVPSARIVLMRSVSEDGFEFFTNYQSHKGEDLKANPRACLNFYWKSLGRQVRITGTVEALPATDSDAYFATRPRRSQLGAWASQQSRPLESYEALMQALEENEKKYEGKDVPRPPHWGGYRVIPEQIEFWQGETNRLHQRIRFLRSTGGWQKQWVNP